MIIKDNRQHPTTVAYPHRRTIRMAVSGTIMSAAMNQVSVMADNPLDLRLKLRFPSSSHLDVENQRLRTERVNSAYSPDQSEPSSPGKSTGI